MAEISARPATGKWGQARLNICVSYFIRSRAPGTTAAPQKVRFRAENPKIALFEHNPTLGGEGRKPGSQGMVGTAAQSVDESGHLAQMQRANHHLDGTDLAGLHGERAQAQ